MWPWIKHCVRMVTTDEDAFRRWATGVGGLAGGFLAAFPDDAVAMLHVPVSAEIAKWAGIALAGGGGVISPKMLRTRNEPQTGDSPKP